MFKASRIISDIINVLPRLERVLFHFANLIGQKESFNLRISGQGSIEVILFWGLIVYRKGQIFEIHLRCTPSALNIMHRALLRNALNAQTKLLVAR
jgi:FtsH-binding integral membrane protein